MRRHVMTKEQKKKRIMDFLKYFSGHFGSAKLNKALGIPDNDKNWITHQILQELESEGKVEQSKDKKGFRWKQQG